MGTLVSCSTLLLGHNNPHGVGEEIPLAQLLKGYQPSSLGSTPQRDPGGPDPKAQQVGFLESWLHSAGHRASHLRACDKGAPLGSSRQLP